jgi:NTP pyrophosphatase (non-canonical NTP hydrolase)
MNVNQRIELQNAEFDACNELAKQWRRIQMTPAVDDDYGMVRGDYEAALLKFLKATHANRDGQKIPPVTSLDGTIDGMRRELMDASAKWPPFNSAHEGFAVLAEEVDELWDHVKVNQKRRDLPAMRKEALQVAAMALRFALDVCDEQRGRK